MRLRQLWIPMGMFSCVALSGPCYAGCTSAAQVILRITPENQELQAMVQEFVEKGGPFQRPTVRVDARRLVNEETWMSAMKSKVLPIEIYPDNAVHHWVEAATYVADAKGALPIETETLQKLHQIAMQDHFYYGFEYRRKLRSNSKISKNPDKIAEMTQTLRRVRDTTVVAEHTSLNGKIRDNQRDPIFFAGLLEHTRSPLSAAQLAALRNQPYLRLVSVKVTPHGRFKVAGFLGDVKDVEGELSKILRAADSALKQTGPGDLDQVVRITVKMGQELTALHPFLDGNGRVIRLLMDSIYMRFGLPPPLHPNELELTMTLDEAVAVAKADMRRYLEALPTK